MKLYLTLKSIPELTDLPTNIRKKNFKEACHALPAHITFWAGAAVAVICNIIFSTVYDYYFPGRNIWPYNITRGFCVVFPGMILWYQFNVYIMRKHYRHILEQGKKTGHESDSERLIREADTREYQQWRYFRYFASAFLIIISIVSVLLLSQA